MCSLFLAASLAWGGSNGEALFKEGKYQQAAQAFAEKDMENPQDARWRYNRGVASYMAEDLEGAQSAFTSAGLRTKDPEIQFRSAYNLGTSMLKGEDYENAVKQFQKALAMKPQDEDARENLKLALWRQALQQQQQEQEQEQEQEQNPSGDQQQQDGQQNHEDGKNQDSQEQQDKDGQQQNGQQQDGQQKESQGQDQQQQAQGSPNDEQGQDPQEQAMTQNTEDPEQPDLDGEMQAVNKPEPDNGEQQAQARMSAMEKKMAETLLDNVKENRVFRPDNKSAIMSDERANSGKRW